MFIGLGSLLIGLGISCGFYAAVLAFTPLAPRYAFLEGWRNPHALALDNAKDDFDRVAARIDFDREPPRRYPAGVDAIWYGGFAFALGMGIRAGARGPVKP